MQKFSEEFRREAVRLVRESDKPVRALGAELGVSETTLRHWLRAIPAGKPTAPGRVPNVVNREFSLESRRIPADVTWAGDITYIPTREGWLYLAVLLDLATRRVVGWALRTGLDQDLTLSALRMALLHRGARGGRHHSDRGVQVRGSRLPAAAR